MALVKTNDNRWTNKYQPKLAHKSPQHNRPSINKTRPKTTNAHDTNLDARKNPTDNNLTVP
jgi:hypothetical protein